MIMEIKLDVLLIAFLMLDTLVLEVLDLSQHVHQFAEIQNFTEVNNAIMEVNWVVLLIVSQI